MYKVKVKGGHLRLLFFFLLFPINSHALFQKIYFGYKDSDRLKAINLDEKIIQADFDFNLNRYDWRFELGGNASDSYLQSLFSFQSQQTIKNTYSLGVTKSSFKYGTFSLSHQQSRYDISNWEAASLSSFSDDELYETKNIINYSYDFLNRSGVVDLEKIHVQNEIENIKYSLEVQKDYLDFFHAYSDAKIRIILERYYNEFERRAAKRVNLVRKRVRDGLSRSHELSQAQISLLSQQETVLKNKNLLRERLIALENLIRIKIEKAHYQTVDWTYKEKERFIPLFQGDTFLELKQLEKLNKLNDLNITLSKTDADHSLNLGLSYAKNSVDTNKSEAFNNSFGSGVNDEATVALTYSIPIGNLKTDTLKKKLLAQRNKTKLSQMNLKADLLVKIKVLNENIERYKTGIQLAKKRVQLSTASIDQHQKLYVRGQVSFEEVLRSEEAFISAKISLVNMFSLYDLSLAQLAFLHGNTVAFLNKYTD